MNVSDKVILVTGGSRGLGKAIVTKLAQEGAKVAFTFRNNQDAADTVVNDLKEQGFDQVVAIKADIQKSTSSEQTVDQVVERFGHIDALVNNAGITKDSAFYNMSNENWEAVINTNLNGVFYLSKAYLQKAIRNTNGGKIVNMSSVSGIKGLKGQANYCASKGGLIALTRSLAVEYAKFNIQVNAIAPGYIATEMVGELDDTVQKKISKTIPLKRLGCPKDIANITSFLLSDSCNYLTGQTIVVDGGLSA